MDTIKNYLLTLYKENKAYAILQTGYSIIAIFSLMICGIIALINQSVGVNLLFVPCAAAAILGINALFWSILKTLLDSMNNSKKK